MPLSMYDLTAPVFLRGLEIVDGYCDMAADFAARRGIDPSTLVKARLAPDMLPLSGQIQCASDGAKLPLARLAGVTAPRFEDNEQTLPELKLRIRNTVAFVRSITPSDLIGSDTRQVVGKFFEQYNLSGSEYLLRIALPNFFFHVTIAHGILRHSGVPVGKRDYLFPASEMTAAVGGT